MPYYAVFSHVADRLRIFKLKSGKYTEEIGHGDRLWIPEAGLWLGAWRGIYNGADRLWLRWYDAEGNLIPTNAERAEQERARAEQESAIAEMERQRAEQERLRAEQERLRADQEKLRAEQANLELARERERAERMAEMLRQMGKDPDQI